MVYLPDEIINIILSYRGKHPLVKCIEPSIEKYKNRYILNEEDLKHLKFFNFQLSPFCFNESYFETIQQINYEILFATNTNKAVKWFLAIKEAQFFYKITKI